MFRQQPTPSFLKCQYVCTAKGKHALLYDGELFYRAASRCTASHNAWLCRAAKESFLKKHNGQKCSMVVFTDLKTGQAVDVVGSHSQHDATYSNEVQQYKWNYHRKEIKRDAAANPDKSTRVLFNRYKRDIVGVGAGTQGIPRYSNVKSTLDRVRQQNRGVLPATADNWETINQDLLWNVYGAKSQRESHGRMAQKLHHNLQYLPEVHAVHSYAQNAMCKGMSHLHVDGTFNTVPFIQKGGRPWAQSVSILVGKGGRDAYTGV